MSNKICKRVYKHPESVKEPVTSNDKLKLADVLCCVCKSVLVEPVSLPCKHRFCRSCWLATDTLRCILCRKRVGSWLRESARRNHLVDEQLWIQIRDQFSEEINKKLTGLDVACFEETAPRRLSAPGEIRAEYEAELKRLAAERLLLEQKNSIETESLIRKLQEEEEITHKAFLDKMKQDEELARQLQKLEEEQIKRVRRESVKSGDVSTTPKSTANCDKKAKVTIDRFLVKKSRDEKKIKNENSTTPVKDDSQNIEEEQPKYGCFMEDFTNTKLSSNSKTAQQKPALINTTIERFIAKSEIKTGDLPKKTTMITKAAQKQFCPDLASTNPVQYLPVSLPYSKILNKSVVNLKATTSSDSVDSMKQELCYFKPIQTALITSRTKAEMKEALRVPAVRGVVDAASGEPPVAPESPRLPGQCHPSRPADYWHGLKLLRRDSSTPSAFVCLIQLQGESSICDVSDLKFKSKAVYKSQGKEPLKHVYSFRRKPTIAKVSKEDKFRKLRRSRSTSNIPKMIKESKRTPTRIYRQKRMTQSETKLPSQINYEGIRVKMDRVKLVSKNLASPLEACDAALCKAAECEESNNNWERGPEGEWGEGYALRRVSAKRRPAVPHALMLGPNKKIKV